MSAKLRRNWKRFFTGKNLWVTNTASTVALLTLGDIGAQLIERKLGEPNEVTSSLVSSCGIDAARALKMGSLGLLIGPWQTGLYIILDRKFPGNKFSNIAKKILFDQLDGIPLYSFSITGLALMEGKSWQESIEHCKAKFLPMYLADLCIWPAVQFYNFYKVPPPFRVTYVNVINFLWCIGVSVWYHH